MFKERFFISQNYGFTDNLLCYNQLRHQICKNIQNFQPYMLQKFDFWLKKRPQNFQDYFNDTVVSNLNIYNLTGWCLNFPRVATQKNFSAISVSQSKIVKELGQRSQLFNIFTFIFTPALWELRSLLVIPIPFSQHYKNEHVIFQALTIFKIIIVICNQVLNVIKHQILLNDAYCILVG